MIDLNDHAKTAQEIALNRWIKNDVPYSTPEILKHCAGEVVEAMEALDDRKYLIDNDASRAALAGELADVITCVLIAAANEKIDIEVALEKCLEKNARRALEGKK